jgi:hypothetical protein
VSEVRRAAGGRDDGYEGPAELVDGASVLPVAVRLAGYFDAISGSYRWYGRVGADPAVTALAGARTFTLRTPHGAAVTPLADVDPWGRYRVEGFGAPPFEVTTDLPAADERGDHASR